jgi:hypothetical protein
MKIIPKFGVDELLFGMKQPDVQSLYGTPNKQFEDEEGNVIYLYYPQKLRLTFYEEEDFRLGYIIVSNLNAQIQDYTIINQKLDTVKENLLQLGFKKWTHESFDSFENYFNEENWFLLQTEFDSVIKVEMGAIINDDDNFDWKCSL